MSQKVAWNKDRTKSVVLSKLKEFTITNMEQQSHMAKPWSVRGWFNQENSFSFGQFETEAEARNFLESIHRMF